MSGISCNAAFSKNALLGGRVQLWQPRQGYRAAIDPILLAAAVPAKSGQFCLELGIGSGAASLCLLARLTELGGITGLEIDPEQAHLARLNVDLNRVSDRLQVIEGDATRLASDLSSSAFDHAFMNPPYLEADRHDPPPGAAKRQAHMEKDGALEAWIAAAARLVKPKGTLTIIHRADRLSCILAALSRQFGSQHILPLWPRTGMPAKRVIVQAVRGGRGALVLLPGIVLHGGQDYTQDAEAILRHGQAIEMKG
ncbi:MAG: methyltransferase [Alphaproteobacteria bacterium]|nr:methyltransferase [Alphaproteobacteria bacterium]